MLGTVLLLLLALARPAAPESRRAEALKKLLEVFGMEDPPPPPAASWIEVRAAGPRRAGVGGCGMGLFGFTSRPVLPRSSRREDAVPLRPLQRGQE